MPSIMFRELPANFNSCQVLYREGETVLYNLSPVAISLAQSHFRVHNTNARVLLLVRQRISSGQGPEEDLVH